MADNKKVIQAILNANKDKRFVQRINEIGSVGQETRDFPYIKNPDNSISTHLMATSEADGRYFVYPTIIEDPKKGLIKYKDNEAFRKAIETGNFIEFPTEEEALYFSENYKAPWNK